MPEFSHRFTGPILFLIAASAILSTTGLYESSHWSISPALAPTIVSGMLLVLSAAQTLKDMGRTPVREESDSDTGISYERFAFVIFGYAVYTLLILRTLPFDIGTMLFLGFVLGSIRRWRLTRGDLIYLVIFSFSLTLIFELALQLPLPGQPSVLLRLIEFTGN